jgi:ribonuclease P protein component
VIGRIVRSADFERVLGTPTRARSAHFAVHHLPDVPGRPAVPRSKRLAGELSTGQAPNELKSVDDSAPAAPLTGCWLGTVVPKRHAKRAATRNLIKRQMRRAAAAQAALPAGLWVVRLRTPFPVQSFPSAASEALSVAAAEELAHLLADAARRKAG